ncbi:MAG: formate C-acetyltransferase [Erysipelothrix sp.]|nr:formate C-acetyltransferase [Erysipelothrix sp.]
MNAHRNFVSGQWQTTIDVENFIQTNLKSYEGDESFLAPISDKTDRLWKKCEDLLAQEIKLGVLDIDLEHVSGVNHFKPGYIHQEDEVIVGLQSDAPLKRIINPYGGYRLVENILQTYGREMPQNIKHAFEDWTKTHNQGVFDVYTKDMKTARSTGLLTGLPDAYGRGRIIGDYRRVALYGIDALIQAKKKDHASLSISSDEKMRLKEEVANQIRSLEDTKAMASSYGFDISRPANDAKEAIQWVYFAYLAAVKQSNGAAMSLGRTSSFLDIFIERDLNEGLISELEAQELIDQFIMKLRLVRHLRTPEYDELFAGDPTWVTEAIAGMGLDGRPLVTKNSFRFLHTLTNLGPAPEPNMTILWSESLPHSFKEYCARMSIETGAIQYENDDLMRPIFGCDYGISCCVSAMTLGKQMQFFGARVNLGKALLLSINGGHDEMSDKVVFNDIELMNDEILDYDTVMKSFDQVLQKIAKLYTQTMNVIHYMHDKYAYESIQMALHDTSVERLMAFGVAGLSVIADSLSAIKYAKVTPVRNEQGITTDFKIEGDFPCFGNDDDRVDSIAVDIVTRFSRYLKLHPLYRDAKHTLSVLTITSNVVYGKKTGATPDGRKLGEAFAPGANPMHGRDRSGALASLNSVAKIPYNEVCLDGVSNTFSIVPSALGQDLETQITNTVSVMDGYFSQNAHHLNVNVLDRAKLIDAMENPEKYPHLTIRVSGYAVHFARLTKAQKQEVIARTFHESV